MLRLTFLLLIVVIASELTLASAKLTDAEKAVNKKKAKMNEFMKDLLYADSIEDLIKHDVRVKKSRFRSGAPKIASILGRSNYGPMSYASASNEEEATINATPGRCDPKPVCISNPLTFSITSSQFAWPQCINIHRCDGCCQSNEKCVPIGHHNVTLHKVGVISFVDSNMELKEYDESPIVVSNHTECQCQCKWKTDKDCQIDNPNLVRNPDNCECICPEEIYCDAYHEFDKDSCKCKCRQDIFKRLEKNCEFRGFTWNDESCKCDARRARSVYNRSVRVVNRYTD